MIGVSQDQFGSVGEGSEEGRRAIGLLYPCYSTSAWIEEVIVRRLRLGPASLLAYSFG